MDKVGLSDWQLEGIVRGLPFFERLLSVVYAELATLQHGMRHADGVPHSQADALSAATPAGSSVTSSAAGCSHGSVPCSSAAAAGSAAAAAAATTSGTSLELLAVQRARLEAQQQHAARMDVVCRKHALLSAACIAWLVGQLTWMQAARIAVLSWPNMIKMHELAQAFRQQWAARQQGSQQQGTAPSGMSLTVQRM
jgi:hypothetical protein